MSRSKIIMELANNSVTVETALLRLKVILSSLNNKLINAWINKEINGYEYDDELPLYRVTEGFPTGTIITPGYKYNDAVIPISTLPIETQNWITEIKILQGIPSLEESLSKGTANYKKHIGREVTQIIEKKTNGHIAEMVVNVDVSDVKKVISSVRLKVLDICLQLESDFDILDELDILDNLDDKIKTMTGETIISFIFDHSVKMGDNNKIVKSEIGNQHE